MNDATLQGFREIAYTKEDAGERTVDGEGVTFETVKGIKTKGGSITNSGKAFLARLRNGMFRANHNPSEWSRNRWGFHARCLRCGAVVSCTVTAKKIKEFPSKPCER